MSKMYKIQERDPLEFSDKIDGGNRLYIERLVQPSEMSDAVNGRAMKPDFDEVSFANRHDWDGVPLLCPNLTDTQNIASQ
jgi:hypothetical protein